MKIALCISGHLRKFEETHPTLYFHLLKNHDCDIFVHTWDKLGYACQFKTDNILDSTNHKLEDIERVYRPKKLIVESSSFIDDLKRQADVYAPHLSNCPKHAGHMASMFYKIYACNELRKNYELETGTKYDLVIRCRPDLLFNNEIIIPQHDIQNKILMPRASSNADWYNDQFAIANPEDMDLYASAYFDLPAYFKQKLEYYPEKFLRWSLDKKQLQAEWWNIYFTILR